jgi:4-hydroxythreonine-4-phosphate dehydrogenase
MSKKIAITIGNPNGIGPEITAKALKKFLKKKKKAHFIVIGNKKALQFHFKDFSSHLVSFVSLDDTLYRFKPGEKSKESGRLSHLFLEKAVEMAKNQEIEAIVTAPISKELIVQAGYSRFIDHTTFFSQEFETPRSSMLFYSNDLKVLLATIHLPLSKVSQAITYECLEIAVENAAAFCGKTMKRNFTIAICGLNPHAGENGLLGKEEKNIIEPAVESFRRQGLRIKGPLPADTAFYYALKKKVGLVIALYHDQGLAPFKLLHFMDGVNVTLGLPIVRTSPDHGTAFDIAGKGLANEKSMLCAIELSVKLL